MVGLRSYKFVNSLDHAKELINIRRLIFVLFIIEDNPRSMRLRSDGRRDSFGRSLHTADRVGVLST